MVRDALTACLQPSKFQKTVHFFSPDVARATLLKHVATNGVANLEQVGYLQNTSLDVVGNAMPWCALQLHFSVSTQPNLGWRAPFLQAFQAGMAPGDSEDLAGTHLVIGHVDQASGAPLPPPLPQQDMLPFPAFAITCVAFGPAACPT